MKSKNYKVKKWPILYKKSKTGKIELWSIKVEYNLYYPCIYLQYGEVGGKLQNKCNEVKKGKNPGKKNETTAEQQAIKEAEAKWKKQIDKGYVESIVDANAGIENLSAKKGGIKPMLAHDYDDQKDKIKFPCFVQPKLDGMRCIITRIDGDVKMWSRDRNPILSCPHIIEDVKVLLCEKLREGNLFLDGELYLHEYSDEFEKIMKAVRKQYPTEESKKIEFHIYDMGFFGKHDTLPYTARHEWIENLPDWATSSIKIVETKEVNSHAEIKQLRKQYESDDYEGLMIRKKLSFYTNNRTTDLLKYKIWKDNEFEIVDVVKGKDKTIMFWCIDKKGERFKATKTGNKDENQKYYKKKHLYIGEMLNVRYFKMTKKNKVPRFGQAIYIRSEE